MKECQIPQESFSSRATNLTESLRQVNDYSNAYSGSNCMTAENLHIDSNDSFFVLSTRAIEGLLRGKYCEYRFI